MASRVIDLTLGSSPLPVQQAAVPKHATRSTTEGVRVRAHAVPTALGTAISTIDEAQLRSTLLSLIQDNTSLVTQLSGLWLVKGKDVVRYHVDTDDENRDESEESSEEEDSDSKDKSVDSETKRIGKLLPILVADEENTPRFAKCLNCKEEFDVTSNERGDCIWHPGDKDWDNDNDFWSDHDERIHGRYEDLEDDPDYEDGFLWNCCDEIGSNEGCKQTRHKALVNKIVDVPCDEGFNVDDNCDEACERMQHGGDKTVDYDSALGRTMMRDVMVVWIVLWMIRTMRMG